MIEEVDLVPSIYLRRTRRNVVGVIIVAATCCAATLVFINNRSMVRPTTLTSRSGGSSAPEAARTVTSEASPQAFAALQASLKESLDFPVAHLHGKSAASQGHIRKSSSGAYCIETTDGGSCFDAPTDNSTLTLLSTGGSSTSEARTVVVLVPKQYKEIVVRAGDDPPMTLPAVSLSGPQFDGLVAFEVTAGIPVTATAINPAGKPQSSLKVTLGSPNQRLTELSPGVFGPCLEGC